MAAETNTTPAPDFRECQARTLLHHLVQFIHINVDTETIAVAHIHGGPYCIVTAAVPLSLLERLMHYDADGGRMPT